MTTYTMTYSADGWGLHEGGSDAPYVTGDWEHEERFFEALDRGPGRDSIITVEPDGGAPYRGIPAEIWLERPERVVERADRLRRKAAHAALMGDRDDVLILAREYESVCRELRGLGLWGLASRPLVEDES